MRFKLLLLEQPLNTIILLITVLKDLDKENAILG